MMTISMIIDSDDEVFHMALISRIGMADMYGMYGMADGDVLIWIHFWFHISSFVFSILFTQ